MRTCVAAGIDYMEMGYKASRKGIKQGEHGCWKYCTEDDLRRIVGENKTDLKLTVDGRCGTVPIITTTFCRRRTVCWM